jgi:hypothetical protein
MKEPLKELRWLMREKYERALEDDSSHDEDEEIMPGDWQSYNFSQLTINPGVNVTWEYRENEVSVKAPYAQER